MSGGFYSKTLVVILTGFSRLFNRSKQAFESIFVSQSGVSYNESGSVLAFYGRSIS